jgi:hypothetical protein
MNKACMNKLFSVILLLCMTRVVFAADHLAYLAYTDGYWQVWVKVADQPKQITHSAYDKIRISWYPDGQHLLLNGQQGELAQLDINNGKETPIAAPFENITDAMISPNAQQLAFSINTADSKDGNNIWLYTFTDKTLLRLTQLPYLQHQPVWAPDGKTLYFLSSTSLQNHDLWHYQLPQKKLEKLTADNTLYFDIAVSKKNDLLYSKRQGQQFDLWYWPQQQTPRALISSPAFEGQPAWGAQGFYFVSDRDQAFRDQSLAVKNVLNIFYCELPCSKPAAVTQHQQGARAPVVWF